MNELSRYWFPPLIPLWLTPWRVGVGGGHAEHSEDCGKGDVGLALAVLPNVGLCAQSLSRIRPFVAPWTVAYQAQCPEMGFSRQEYWSGLDFLFQGIFLTQGSNSRLSHPLH